MPYSSPVNKFVDKQFHIILILSYRVLKYISPVRAHFEFVLHKSIKADVQEICRVAVNYLLFMIANETIKF